MAKKVSATFTAELIKNDTKGGAWLAKVSIKDEGVDSPIASDISAWSNASAGKRWVKERIQALTPRKSVKMIPSQKLDAKGKPIAFIGIVGFKRDI
jgi:hypothetical protein